MPYANPRGSQGKQLYTSPSFARGMYYTKGVIAPGYSQIIANYNISPNGDRLYTRDTYSKKYETTGHQISFLSKTTNNIIYLRDLWTVKQKDYIEMKVPGGVSNTSGRCDARHYNDPTMFSTGAYLDDSYLGIKRNLNRVFTVEVVDVIDGDTLMCIMPKSDGTTEFASVRLLGVDATELFENQKWSTEAKYFLNNALAESGYMVGIEYDPELGADYRDKYGRHVAYVWVNDWLLNADLLRTGLAGLFLMEKTYKYYDKFVQFEDKARESKLGIHGDSPANGVAPALLRTKNAIDVRFLVNDEASLEDHPIEYYTLDHRDGVAVLGQIIIDGKLDYQGIITLEIDKDYDHAVIVKRSYDYYPTLVESVNMGLNLMLDNPMEYKSFFGDDAKANGHYFLQIFGLIPYKKGSNQILSQATSISEVEIRASAAVPPLDENTYAGYAVRWEYSNTETATFTLLSDWRLSFGSDGEALLPDPLKMPEISIGGSNITVRLSIAPILKSIVNTNLYSQFYDGLAIDNDTTKTINDFRDVAVAFLTDPSRRLGPFNKDYYFMTWDRTNKIASVYFFNTVGIENVEIQQYENGDLYLVNLGTRTSNALRIDMQYDVATYAIAVSNWQMIGFAPSQETRIGYVDDNENYYYLVYYQRIRHSTAVDDITGEINERIIVQGILPSFSINALTNRTIDLIGKHLNLKKATHLTQFYRQAVLYGGHIGDNILQFSAFEQLDYFPFPNNTVSFTEPIVYAHVHNDRIIVFGRENIHMLYGGLEPLDLRQAKIYSNLSITPREQRAVCSLGKDVFFLSDNKGYLIRPSLYVDNVEEINVMRITEPIEELLANPREYIVHRLMLDYRVEVTNINQPIHRDIVSYSYNRKLYLFATYKLEEDNISFMIVYIYDTDNRRWMIYDMMGGTHIRHMSTYENGEFLTKDGIYTFEPTYTEEVHTYLASGHLDISKDHQKRFHSMYFVFNNTDGREFESMLGFKVDGVTRQSAENVKIELNDEGYLTAEEERLVNMIIPRVKGIILPGATNLVDEDSPFVWNLDFSQFPTMEQVKVEFGISGKGRLPSFELSTHSEGLFELLYYGIIYKKKGV